MKRALYWLFRSDRFSNFDIILLVTALWLPAPAWAGLLLIAGGLFLSAHVEGFVKAWRNDKP
jgi:hypothetical protein